MLNAKQIQDANDDLLRLWKQRLIKRNAIPMILLGYVRNDNRPDDMVLCTAENGPGNREVAAILRDIADSLDRVEPGGPGNYIVAESPRS